MNIEGAWNGPLPYRCHAERTSAARGKSSSCRGIERRRRSAAKVVNVSEKYLEDFAVGQTYGSGRLTVDEDRIKTFAAEFDPQPFHMDDEAARDSMFGGLAASGWHTAALTMRLLVDGELEPAGGIIGLGFDELRWPRPVHPGDELRVESEVLEVRPSKSRPNQGSIKVRTTTRNQNGEAVQVTVVPHRTASPRLVRRRQACAIA